MISYDSGENHKLYIKNAIMIQFIKKSLLSVIYLDNKENNN